MSNLFFSNIEYVALRVIRKFLFPQDLHRLGRYLPFYRTNLGESQPSQISNLYIKWLGEVQRAVTGQHIAEVGSGATNAVGYALICAGAEQVWCVEPFVEFDAIEDASLLDYLARMHGRKPSEIANSVTRCASLAAVGEGNADIILSHSVLEHVGDLVGLLSNMRAALCRNGVMLHIVDYRDHFFKYPLHFLQFSKQTWERFLNPGDLPRWRLGHHLSAMFDAGFDARVIDQEADANEFARIRKYISSDFDVDDERIGVLRAVVFATPKA